MNDPEYESNLGTKIEAEGYKAGCANKSANENPYMIDSWKHDIWEQGRISAQQ